LAERDSLSPESICEHLIRYYGSVERPRVLLAMLRASGRDDLFWPCVTREWAGFDLIDQDAYAREFRRLKPIWSIEHWTAEDRNAFAALPDPFMAYWGGDEFWKWKYCWTTDVSVAASFARGHRGIYNQRPQILVAPIRKSNVCMHLNERNESEVVLFRRPSHVRLHVADHDSSIGHPAVDG
jgi:hypothetical protein